MKEKPKTPPHILDGPGSAAEYLGAEPSAFERMRDFTRRLVAVPKSELEKPKPKARRRH